MQAIDERLREYIADRKNSESALNELFNKYYKSERGTE